MLLRKTRLHVASALLATSFLAPSANAQIDEFIDAGRGLVQVHLPPAINDGAPLPLIIQLHGYGADANSQEDFFRLIPESDARGFILVTPDGLPDLFGLQYWNGTDACCAFFSNPDDSGYLRGLIDVAQTAYAVDPKRIYFAGYSNGGFMSHRMACDHADTVAGVFSFAGAQWEDPINCAASEPVHVAQVHGTADTVIQYDGGCIPGAGCYPSARGTVETWAGLNGCELGPQLVRPLRDLVEERVGRDTFVQEYPGCAPGGSAQLWTIPGTTHFPGWRESFPRQLAQFLLSRAKP
ncbi:MAG: PHB depolymerase family esterase [Pseudomonadota bacterium]